MKFDREARRAARRLATDQAGVVTRAQLRDLGLGRHAVANDWNAGRCEIEGRAVISTPVISDETRWRVALANSGPGAVLDGVTALFADGLAGWSEDKIHLSVPPGARLLDSPEVSVHMLRCYDPDDVTAWSGLRRTRPPVAAVRAAIWMRTDRQAQTILVMTAQQKLATGLQLAAAAAKLPRNKRKALVADVAAQIVDGAMSVPEIDFAKLCQRYGLPKPTRQTKRCRPDGAAYLDVYWAEYGLVVEIDGVHHGWAENVVADSLRHNDIALQTRLVLRIPTGGLHETAEAYMTQVRLGLIGGGWVPEC